jgi:multiple sugar transport system permease protein
MKSETVQFVPAIDEAVAGKGSQAMKFLAGLKNVRVWCGLLLSLCVLAPLMMMVTISLNPDEEQIMISMGTIKAFIPHVLSLENYREIWGDPNQPFARYLFNTLLIVFTTVFMSIVVNSSAAFALAWGQGGYRKIVIGVVVALLAIPGESLALPQLLMVSKMGIIDSYEVQILPFIGNAMSLFLFYQFFTKIPKDLIDAAKVDGVSLFKTYLHIGLPLSKPVIATVAILQFLEFWNSYLWPVMVTRGPEYRPLSVAMSAYFGSNQAYWGNIMAFAVSMAIPVIIFFLFIQRHFVQSITGSAVKG